MGNRKMYSTVSVGFNATGSPTTVTTTSGYVSGPESQQNVNGTVAPLGSVRQVPPPTPRETQCHQRMPVKKVTAVKSPGRGMQGIRLVDTECGIDGENKGLWKNGSEEGGVGTLPPPPPPPQPFILCTCLHSTIVGRQPMKI